MTPTPIGRASSGATDLVERAQAGDRRALDQLLREHQTQIHAVCRRITGNDADALDATQDSLIAVVRGLPRFDGRSRFSTWVYRVATNTCLDELRRKSRRPVPIDPGTVVGPVSDDRTGEVAERLVLDDALAELSPEFRVAVVLRDLCQLDYAEIAQVLEVPVGTVRSRIARGRGRLAEMIGHDEGSEATAPEASLPDTAGNSTPLNERHTPAP